MGEFIAVTCNLSGGGSVIFDVSDTVAGDAVEEFTLADYYSSVIGA